MKASILLATGVLCAAPLAAQAGGIYANDMKFVVGGAVSRDQSNFDDVLNGDSTLASSSIRVQEPDAGTGTNLYVGVRFNPYITGRLGYRNFGDADSDVQVSGVDTGRVHVEADGVYVAVDGLYPFTDQFALGGTLGVQNWNGDLRVRGPGGTAHDSEDARDFFYGVRADFRMTKTASLTASYDFYSFDVEGESEDVEYKALALGLEFAF